MNTPTTPNVESKSKDFSIRVINLYKYISENYKEFVITRQILRSGTSIGANIAEAQAAQTKKDFLAKIYIAFKECSETKYWLEILFRSEYLTPVEYHSMLRDCEELYKMLSSITKTTEKRLSKNIQEEL